jgi:hypothetical protein
MFTVIDESMPNAQADFEQNANENHDFSMIYLGVWDNIDIIISRLFA